MPVRLDLKRVLVLEMHHVVVVCAVGSGWTRVERTGVVKGTGRKDRGKRESKEWKEEGKGTVR